MSPTDEAPGPLLDLRAVTVVFVGGRMRLSDGTEVDSRQPTSDVSTTRAVLGALTSAPEWWGTVSSIVAPTLDDNTGGFALLFGPRTTDRATAEGEARRSSLKRLLRGGVGTVSLRRSGIGAKLPDEYQQLAILRNWQGVHMGEVGVRPGESSHRWRFLDGGEFYLRVVAGQLGARVVVDAMGTFLANAYGSLGLGSLAVEFPAATSFVGPDVLVLPDTMEIRRRVEAILTGSPIAPMHEDPAGGPPPFHPNAARDAGDYLKLAVVHADCKVSGLLRGGAWEDGGGLEAARMLVLKRFDLRLGLWDLALNPVLRSTALDPEATHAPPKGPVEPPASARQRAQSAAERATVRRKSASHCVEKFTRNIQRPLARLGWVIDDAGRLSLPLTERLSNWPGSPKRPLVILRADVTKNAVGIVAWQWFYNDLDIAAFVETRRDAFDAVAPLHPSRKDPSSVALWSASTGWGAGEAGALSIARAIAERTEAWSGLLADFVTSCRAVRGARFARQRQ